jgi:hypothetical protein
MTGGGAAGVGKGLGMGLTEALSASRIAKEDVQQGKAVQADPRLMQIYETIGMPGRPS